MKHDLDVLVIGGGTAGLVAAAGTAAFGARTALIERHRLGGECTWTGCVPSKALLHAARQIHTMRQAASSGIRAETIAVDFAAVMATVRATRRWIYDHGETPAYLISLGIQPLQASGRFLDDRTALIERDGRRRELTFRAAIIASGSRPFVPEVPGLEEIDFLTTDTLFEIDELPQRLAILGGGATGVEMAQAFARLGSDVTLISHDDRLIAHVDDDASELLRQRLSGEGVDIHLRATIAAVSPAGRSAQLRVAGDGEPLVIEVDRLLLATGRMANTSGLGLEAAGVDYERGGIPVDAYCRTSASGIYATGDVTTALNLTHVAEEMSKAAAVNALSKLPVIKYEQAVVPTVVYTDPEVATVGRTARELRESGIDYDRIDLPYEKIDRAVIEGHGDGFVRVYHRRGKVLGATVVGASAGELIAEYALAMRHGLRLHQLAGTIHAYPTMMLGARRAADQFLFRSLRPWMASVMRAAYGYRGKIPEYVGTRQIV